MGRGMVATNKRMEVWPGPKNSRVFMSKSIPSRYRTEGLVIFKQKLHVINDLYKAPTSPHRQAPLR